MTVGAVLVGSPREVQHRLKSVEADLVIALAVDQTDARRAKLLAQTLASVVPLVEASLAEHEVQTVKALVDALLPKVPRSPVGLKEAASRTRPKPRQRAG